jgi:ankyrin repeat protein
MPKGSSSSSASGKQLFEASKSGNIAAVRKLLDKGVDVNWKDDEEGDEEGDTALTWASEFGHIDIIKLLLDRGALIDLQDNIGGTGLMYASHFGQVECVRFLLERGADMSIKDTDGMTARDQAVEQRQVGIVLLLDEVCMLQTRDKCFKYCPMNLF